MKKPQIIGIAVVGLVVVVAGWWLLLYSPKNAALTKAKTDFDKAKTEESSLNATLAKRKDLVKIEPKLDLRTAQLSTWLPDQPNLPQFINDATAIARESGIDFVSIAPQVPAAGGAGEGVIGLGINIKGGFFQLLDYLNRVSQLPRSVVVDSVQIAPAPKDGSVDLSVQIQARMFTSSVPQFTSLPPELSAPTAPGTAAPTPGAAATGSAPTASKPSTSATPAPAGAAVAGRP